MTANISVALAKAGEDVLIIDGNLSGPNMSQHIGIDSHHATLNQVARGEAYVTQAVARHSSGVQVIPASLFEFDGEPSHLKQLSLDFLGKKDYIFIDSAPGTQHEATSAVEASDEVMLVANPDITSLTNCIGARQLADTKQRDIVGIVLNRIRNEHFERTADEAEAILGEPVLGAVPESHHIRQSVAEGEPLVHRDDSSVVSETIMDIAERIRGNIPPERGLGHDLRRYLHTTFYS